MSLLLPGDNVIEGIIGGKVEFELALVDENDRAVDTTSFDEFKVCIKKKDGSILEIDQSAGPLVSNITKTGNAQCGLFKVIISPTDSALLKKDFTQDIDFEMAESGNALNIIRIKFKDRLSMDDSVCS